MVHDVALSDLIVMRFARDAFAKVIANVVAAIADRHRATADIG
jgi:hypothetical protein